MWETTERDRFCSLEEMLLWIMDLYFKQKQEFEVKNILMMDLFFTNTQLLSSEDINWWTGVVWITCGLLWCFYQLFGLSFWRHPFTAEHPLLSKGHCTRSPKFSSEFFARKKINTTSRCVNHIYTLPPKLSSVIKKFGSGSIFCVFASVTSILIGKDDKYKKKDEEIWWRNNLIYILDGLRVSKLSANCWKCSAELLKLYEVSKVLLIHVKVFLPSHLGCGKQRDRHIPSEAQIWALYLIDTVISYCFQINFPCSL